MLMTFLDAKDWLRLHLRSSRCGGINFSPFNLKPTAAAQADARKRTKVSINEQMSIGQLLYHRIFTYFYWSNSCKPIGN
jgi:hypothetical protein